jgi:hypothetical protein
MYPLRQKKELIVEHLIQRSTIDGSTPVGEINAWFTLKTTYHMVKEAVEKRLNAMLDRYLT